MLNKITTFVFILVVFFSSLYAQTDPVKRKYPLRAYQTARVSGELPNVDGLDNDPAWELVSWEGDFIQRRPEEGVAPSQATAFKILYDDKNLYILIRAFDSEPDKVAKRMSRRDSFDGDWVEVNLDSYFDKRTAFSFTASASGVKSDEYISNDNDWDTSWDPIWYLKTSIDSQGWIAEIRIPLSQLRFPNQPELVWGLQVNRRHFREQTRSFWQGIPNDANTWVSQFGELRGLKNIKPQRQIEIQPYILAQSNQFDPEEGNPFRTGSSSNLAVGLDGKIRISNDITMDFTINPDFGQVEADPSQVNLTAYQIFFNERRPFFIEGNDRLNFPASQSVAGGFFTQDNLFYSRRIGQRPQYYPNLASGEFADVPTNTSILGAVKLTGKNAKGFSWAVLETVTEEERAEIDNNGERREEVVEPLTNYLVARAQQDIKQGKTVVGGMFTATNRRINESHLDFLHDEAYSAGVDVLHNWQNRKYYVAFKAIYSQVKGSKNALMRTQLRSERFFQRPDANYLQVDSTLRSLNGTGGTLKTGKRNGTFVYETGITWRAPGLELNDIGFLQRADHINQWSWGQYRKLKPFSIFRSFRWNFNEYLAFDFGGTNTYRAFNTNMHVEFKNKWQMGTGSTIEDRFISNGELRGGPAFIVPPGINHWFYIQSDQSKKLVVGTQSFRYWGFEDFAFNQGFNFFITYVPFNALNINLRPSINFRRSELQYVTTRSMEGRSKYILGKIEQETYSLSLRVTYNINPDLSLQYWGQPFIAKGSYSNFKEATNPSAAQFKDRFNTYTSNEIQLDESAGSYLVDQNLDGNTDFSFRNPDFYVAQFRSNLVLRWEYIPGSTFFLVWSQDRNGGFDQGVAPIREGLGRELWNLPKQNVFLLKFAYRFRT